MVALSGELFDAIEVNAARTGNHKRAAVRMSRLAQEAASNGMSRAEAHLRAGEQWLLADEPAEAAQEFRTALEHGGQTFADPRIQLARALFALGARADAVALIDELSRDGHRGDPRTCDMVAEVLAEQGDLQTALDWATAGVDAYRATEPEDQDRDELQLLLRLRYRLRVDLGLDEDEYDKLVELDRPKRQPPMPRTAP